MMGHNEHHGTAYYRYWGKTGEDGQYHLLPYHCLDVAAVGATLLRHNASIRKRLSSLLALEEDGLVALVRFFLGVHDIGKFARHFQALQPPLYLELQGEAGAFPYVRHDALGALLWRATLRPWCGAHGLLGVTAWSGRRASSDSAADFWMHTVVGHHGAPVSDRDSDIRGVASDYFPEVVQSAVLAFFSEWYDLCLAEQTPALPPPKQVKKASWWLAGMAVLCDWLGSNSDYFPLTSEEIPLDAYWPRALKQAEKALAATGVMPSRPAPLKNLQILFGESFQTPTPLQARCLNLPLDSGPGIYLLEDVTGAGKTEAALILAHRLISEQGQDGVYFALPTMATANAMFERMGKVYRRLYADDSAPSLVLAHGARRLHEGFRDAITHYPQQVVPDYGDTTQPAQAHCAAWLADSPKKSLLAEVGVGTVDQAVLGVLPSRHQSLRLFGLLGKVLIIDEVHAYEAYLFRLMCALITFHAAVGGSVILLSATLPHNQRRKLVEAFYEGLGQQALPLQRTGDKDYPLLTHASPDGFEELVLASRPEVCRTVKIARIDTLEQIEALMMSTVEEGRCLCWIRNTVHDAREAFRELRQRHPEWAIDLFHARYGLADRLAIEERVVSRFGKRGGEAERKGQILIATPVVEQSLDIDFDEMVSDLAPIDLIIQRAGRLHRHTRDVKGNQNEGANQRPAPLLHLFAPEPVAEPDREWFAAFLPKAAYVYDNHAQLWLGLRLLIEGGQFTMPNDARRLIEGVYGDVDPPPGLEESYFDAEGERSSEGSLGDYNALKVTSYYGDSGGGRWWSEERAPTRLGDSTTVYLARMEGERVVALKSGGDFPWHGSSVSVLSSRISKADKPASLSAEAWEQALAELPARGKWGVLLVLDGELKGEAVNGRGEAVAVRYSEVEGLLVGEECAMVPGGTGDE